ncbi:hypothetical protein EV102420_14_01010 [Pseudescherichia vulneris NBRC 102420]|uniref:N-acetyltransferase domain-containing protein n=1 Tax=Pseudescherichia vulneris NBRC 102420 TaxID=1115515 RepID=A0A090VV44_PSEVU|nr:hypothetical protein [Pseudescherichia vulneris]GAL59042.1 hypothetical protein EV102420_14_01010 [Pseudescherichia vulneris NBRC 102420]STQ59229.1 Uncharacterised protein [Pseudescherichia vulneris]
MLTLDEIGQSVRSNTQLVIDHAGLPLAIGPISDEDYRVLCGGYGQLEWDYALNTYGNDPDKFEFCIKLVMQGAVQVIPAGAAICIYKVKEKLFQIHLIERFTRDDEDHPLNGRMVLITLMSTYIFCRAAECEIVQIVEPVPELQDFYASFGFVIEGCGYIMSNSVSALEDVFIKFAQFG